MVSAPRSSGHPRRQRVHGRAGHVTKSEVLLAEFSFNEIFFFLLREKCWCGTAEGGGPSHRWRMEIESGGYSRPGYSQLGGRGHIEPDK